MSADSGEPNDPGYWRAQADRALRLAKSIGNAEVADRLKSLAAEYIARAAALVQQRGRAAQQQQQPQQPEKDKDE